jgi:soluble lytic murein transglycosylase-like protein
MRFLVALALLVSSSAVFGVSKEYINNAFKLVSEEEGVDEMLLRAICWVESNHKPHAYRHGDASRSDHAFGMCQILYSTARGLGLKDDKCLRDFQDMLPHERNYSSCKLFGPKTNIRYAARFLKQLLERYTNNEFKSVLAYNSGRYIVCKDGWLYVNQIQEDGSYERIQFKRCLKGGPVNLYYASKVLHWLELQND